MEQAIFEHHSHDRLVNTSFSELFGKDRVLVCSANNPHNRVTQVYLKYLERLQKRLRQHHISRIYVINSFDRWTIPVVEQFFPTLTPVINQDRVFVQTLIDRYNPCSRWSTEFLAEFWEYQVLLSDGQIEHFQHSDTENLDDKILQGARLMIDHMRRSSVKHKQQLLYEQRMLRVQAREHPDLVLRQPEFYGDTDFTRHIRYQGLWPAVNLLQSLALQGN
jgi:hypothetical protein